MMDNNTIIEIIFNTLDEVNRHLPDNQQLEKHINTVLLGSDGKLDSLAFVQVLVATEQHLEDELGVTVTLADEKAMSERSSPFRTVGTLATYISGLLAEGPNGR